jgi:hypothetical protein
MSYGGVTCRLNFSFSKSASEDLIKPFYDYFTVSSDRDQETVLSSHSGLLNYMFGINREKVLTKESFKKLQSGDLTVRVFQYFRVSV